MSAAEYDSLEKQKWLIIIIVEEDCMAYTETFKRLQGVICGVVLAAFVSLILAFLMADFEVGLLPVLFIFLGTSVPLVYIFKLRKGPVSYSLSPLEFTGLWIIIVPGGLFIYWCIGKIPGVDFEFDFWYILTVLVIPLSLFSLMMLIADYFMKGKEAGSDRPVTTDRTSDDSPGS